LDEVLHTFTSCQFQRVTGKEAFTWASPSLHHVLHNNVGIVEVGARSKPVRRGWDLNLKSKFPTFKQALSPHVLFGRDNSIGVARCQGEIQRGWS
jgi:hypothetical protein